MSSFARGVTLGNLIKLSSSAFLILKMIIIIPSPKNSEHHIIHMKNFNGLAHSAASWLLTLMDIKCMMLDH